MRTDLKKRGLVIIGNGITGISVARVVRKLHPNIRIRIISKESPYFFSRTALMYIYMGHMRLKDTYPYEPSFYKKNWLELVFSKVEKVDIETKQLQLHNDNPIEYDYLLLATGSTYNKFGWPGQDLPGVQGLYSLQDLEKLEENTTQHKVEAAVIVGGGLIGIELGEMLHTRGINVTFLVREKGYWRNILPKEEADLVENEINKHHQIVQTNTELKEILAGSNGRVKGVLTSKGEEIQEIQEIPCQLVCLTAGVHPNIELVKDTAIQTDRGVKVNYRMQTNIESVFAAGDCAQLCAEEGDAENRRFGPPVEQLWYTGRMQGSVAGRILAREVYKNENKQEKAYAIPEDSYHRGIWFNSAKFFTVEYQTYGYLPCDIPEEQTFVWQDEKSEKLIRLYWEGNDPQNPILGMNFMGTRFRQEVCTNWIQEQKSAIYVATHLQEASFDPEFYKQTSESFLLATGFNSQV